jgi:predicted RNA binding protein YcfA (HicA-like mRNA interferase family)
VTPKLPSFNSRQVISILAKHGLVLDRQSGSHALFIHPDRRRTTVPIHGKRGLGKGILHQTMRDAELSVEDMIAQRGTPKLWLLRLYTWHNTSCMRHSR